MNILYSGGYTKRFHHVIEQIKDLPLNSQILELCFGDTYIADYCKKRGYRWKGLEFNTHFVAHAKKLGHEAFFADLINAETLPKADVCLMMGSFYHFHEHPFSMLKKMLDAAETVIISEPVSNLASRSGIVGFFARRAANAGKGKEGFRYHADSFMAMIKEGSVILDYNIVTHDLQKKDLIIKLRKNGSNKS